MLSFIYHEVDVILMQSHRKALYKHVSKEF